MGDGDLRGDAFPVDDDVRPNSARASSRVCGEAGRRTWKANAVRSVLFFMASVFVRCRKISSFSQIFKCQHVKMSRAERENSVFRPEGEGGGEFRRISGVRSGGQRTFIFL